MDEQQAPAGQHAAAPAGAKPPTRLRQCVAPFVFGGKFNKTEGFPIVADLLFQFDEGRTLEDTCRIAADIGFEGYDLVGPHSWHILKKYGLTPTMSHLGTTGSPFAGIAEKSLHDELERAARSALKECAAYGVPNIIAMTGPRGESSLEDSADNCVAFLNRVKTQAEDLGVTICLENLNSKVDHAHYLFDRSAWGFEIVRRVDSPRVKVLFDIYHLQVQEGDVVRTLRENIAWIGHIHAAGNPGRCQIDDEQELNYRFIAREIARLGFTGYVGQEYMPRNGSDVVASLKQAFDIFRFSS